SKEPLDNARGDHFGRGSFRDCHGQTTGMGRALRLSDGPDRWHPPFPPNLHQIGWAILQHALRPGTKLPSTRDVDMQVGLLNGPPKHDLQGVIQRINLLTAMVRKRSGKVIWVRHCGKRGGGFERGTEGWSFLPDLSRHGDDLVVEKT